jgi:predicted P-loop ATPase
MKLTPGDYAALALSWITPEIADGAGLYRVPSIEGRDMMGRKGGGNYSGIVFPYRWPGDAHSLLDRLRLDSPPIDPATHKAQHKYLTAPGARNRLYFPRCDAALLDDLTVPVVITEGEKKALALWRAALESNGAGKPAFLPVAMPGVWCWRGSVGIAANARGERVPEKGVIPDFDRVAWTGRKVTILFDVNAATNSSVQAARRELARELMRRGADPWLADLPPAAGVNGCDDFLYLFGAERLDAVLKQAHRCDWRAELIRSEAGKVLPVLANAITALRLAPEWCGALAWNEFAMRAVALRQTPWGSDGEWSDQEDRRTTEWLQHHGILVKLTEAGQAVQTVAQGHSFHPVRQYLDSLGWDGISRIDGWLELYAGAEATELNRAVGARWLISAVARVYQPGCKVDCCLILEGPQDIGKSTALRVLGGDWYSDDVAELGTKDAPIGTRGKWILEFAELDSIAKASPSKIKAFMSRATDHFRLPYDRRAGDFPRECVFAGTVNHSAYLRDETGGRRFWPVVCGNMNLDALRRDRDQIWAEAAVRYRNGDRWWLDTPDLISAAEAEQSERYDDDPWEGPIGTWLEARTDTSVSEILTGAIRKNVEHWVQADKTRVARILLRLKWKRYKKRIGYEFQWRYKYVPSSQFCSQSVPSSK